MGINTSYFTVLLGEEIIFKKMFNFILSLEVMIFFKISVRFNVIHLFTSYLLFIVCVLKCS